MRDINDFRFSGTVEEFRRITNTKSGQPMIAFTVLCWKQKVRAVAFRDLAASTELSTGDRVEVHGIVENRTWTDKLGQARTGWHCLASSITKIDDEHQPRPPAKRQEAHQGRLFPERRPDTNARFQYQDGPF